MAKLQTSLDRRSVRQPLGPVTNIETALVSMRAGASRDNRFRAGKEWRKFGDWQPAVIEQVSSNDIVLRQRIVAAMGAAMGWGRSESGSYIITRQREQAINAVCAAAAAAATSIICDRVDGAAGWERLPHAIGDLYAQRPEAD